MKKNSFIIGFVATAFLTGTITGQWLERRQLVDAYAENQLSALPVEKMQEFAEVLTRIRQHYVEEISADQLIEKALAGMVSSLDPHSSYLTEKQMTNFQKGLTGEEFGGLGIYVGTRDDWIEIISPIFDTPADRAKLQSGDLILKIDGISTKGMKIEDAVKKMRGKVGTLITIEVLSKNGQGTRQVELMREKIVSPSVVSSLTKGNIGYIRVSRFQDKTVKNLVDNLNHLHEESDGNLSGIVLDLRNNPGGFLLAGVDVAAAFLPSGQRVVSDKGRGQEEKVFYSKTSPHNENQSALKDLKNEKVFEEIPLVVLVNNGSASASEIVAGAIQDTRRGVIVGVRTFGKASVQSVAPLRSTGGKTALRLTTARYYTPLGHNIHARGIEPDIVVKPIPPSNDGVEGHLKNTGNDKNTTESDETAAETTETTELSERPPFISEDDNQYNQAVNILKSLTIVSNV